MRQFYIEMVSEPNLSDKIVLTVKEIHCGDITFKKNILVISFPVLIRWNLYLELIPGPQFNI